MYFRAWPTGEVDPGDLLMEIQVRIRQVDPWIVQAASLTLIRDGSEYGIHEDFDW
jgi:hypothetical protein